MARRGQQVALQTDLDNDEEWEKYIEKPGLLLVDIYSDWCGPCAGMVGNLKKIKLEIGGDTLHLAIAKSDTIEALERFRNKSEPTWMFISKQKQTNMMFGSNAPKLMRMIEDELRREIAGESRDDAIGISDLGPEEKERFDAKMKAINQLREIEEAKAAKAKHDRMTAEADAIIDGLSLLGVMVIFAHARDRYLEVLKPVLEAANLNINATEKVNFNEQHLEAMAYFAEDHDLAIPDESKEHLLAAQSLVLLIKPARGAEVAEPMWSFIALKVYGQMRCPPGDPECVYEQLYYIPGEDEDEKKHGEEELQGIWCPLNSRVNGATLKLFFRKLTEPFHIPEPEPPPPYLAVVFEMSKRDIVAEIYSQYPEQFMKYGIFTSENPHEATLIAKTIQDYDQLPTTQKDLEEDKIVIQLSRRKSECLLSLAQETPVYISPSEEDGKIECRYFFPEGYDGDRRKISTFPTLAEAMMDLDEEEEEEEELYEGSANTYTEEMTEEISMSFSVSAYGDFE